MASLNDSQLPPSIYFGGCAFGAAFYVGVYKGMVERWGPEFNTKVLLSGGSVGCIFAIGIGLGISPEELDVIYRSVATKCARHGTIHYASIFMEECVREMLQHPLAYKQLEGRLALGTTYFFNDHRWQVSWESNEDLIACVRRSCHIPFYCQRDRGYKGCSLIIDGAYGIAGTDFPHGDDTLFIGIDPQAEVTRTLTNDQMFYPLVGPAYEEIKQSGLIAFQAWDGTSYLKKVGVRVPNHPALIVLWTLKLTEASWLAVCDAAWWLLVCCLLAPLGYFMSWMMDGSQKEEIVQQLEVQPQQPLLGLHQQGLSSQSAPSSSSLISSTSAAAFSSASSSCTTVEGLEEEDEEDEKTTARKRRSVAAAAVSMTPRRGRGRPSNKDKSEMMKARQQQLMLQE